MMRYVRAFIKAIQMTARGETITPTHFKPLEDWIHIGLQKLAQVTVTADAQGVAQDKRQQLQLKLDGHQTSLEQTLQMVRHNFVTEYPKLMQLNDSYTMMVVQSSNMNDQYRISQFASSEQITSDEVKQALDALNEHLMNLPTIERPTD